MLMRSAVEVLSRRGEVILQAPTEQTTQAVSRKRLWRGVKLGGYNILLDPAIQGEIQDELVIQPVPRCREYCEGLTNLRGNLVALYDVSHYLDKEPSSHRWYLILHTEPAWVGIAMDTLPDQLSLSDTDRLQQMPPLPDKLEPFVKAGYRSDHVLWLELDLQRFFRQLAEQAVVTTA